MEDDLERNDSKDNEARRSLREVVKIEVSGEEPTGIKKKKKKESCLCLMSFLPFENGRNEGNLTP